MKITGWIVLRNGDHLNHPLMIFTTAQRATTYYGGTAWCKRHGFKAVQVTMEIGGME